MAGSPKKRALRAELLRLARAELIEDEDAELTDDQAVLAFVEQWVASGRTQIALADKLSRALGFDVGREQLNHHLRQLQRVSADSDLLSRARLRGAHALAEAAIEEAEAVEPDRDAVAAAKLKIDTKLRIAESWNRQDFGRMQGGVQVAVSIQSLHLEALKARPTAVVHVEHEQLAEVLDENEAPLALASEGVDS